MNRSHLKLVAGAVDRGNPVSSGERQGYENARQLSFFKEDEKDTVFVLSMGEMNRFHFRSLLVSNSPVSIIDTRKYPDFFGIFKSTQFALSYFESIFIDYIHSPTNYTKTQAPFEIWSFRSSIVNLLESKSDKHGLFGQNRFVLVASEDMRKNCVRLLLSLPSANDKWHVHTA